MLTIQHIRRFASFTAGVALIAGLSSCEKEKEKDKFKGEDPYVLSLSVQGSDGNFTYYTIPVEDVMNGKISAVGKGIEQPGYFDFTQVGESIFSIGGLGEVVVKAITQNSKGELVESGGFVFDNNLSDLIQVDDNKMVGVEIPSSPEDGNMIRFYTVSINSATILETKEHLVTDLTALAQPSYGGMRVSGDHLFLSYYLTDPSTYNTDYTDTAYVAVYSYPGLEFQKVIKDTRTGPIGSFNTKCGLIIDEKGDIYSMSNSNAANGFSQSTTSGAFMRIRSGETDFDQSYLFDIESFTGGKNPAHLKYLGNGKVFAEMNMLPFEEQARWSDAPLKPAIIDLYNKTVTYIDGVPQHSGVGRRLPVLYDNGKIYLPVPEDESIFVYEIDPSSATARKGAEIEASFVAGFFRL